MSRGAAAPVKVLLPIAAAATSSQYRTPSSQLGFIAIVAADAGWQVATP